MNSNIKSKRLQFFFVFVFLLSLIFLAKDSSSYESYEIFIRPLEKTLIEFEGRTIKYVEAVSGENLIFSIENFVDKSILKITANAVFSSASFHVIFSNGQIVTFTAYADPTAPLVYSFSQIKKETNLDRGLTSSSAARVFFQTLRPKNEKIRNFVELFSNIENSRIVQIPYRSVRIDLVEFLIDRIVENSRYRLYEIVCQNLSNHTIELDVREFSKYPIVVATIVGMDLQGRFRLRPLKKTYIYLLEEKSD